MEKKLDILIVDYCIEGFKRYAVSICAALHDINPNLCIGACYMQKKEQMWIDGFEEVFCAQDFRLNAKRILEYYEPRALLTFAHRFFDYMFTIEAHRRNIYVFNFQHGLYMDSTVISELTAKSFGQVLAKKREQFKIYLQCSFNMNQRNIFLSIRFFLNFLRQKSLYRVVNSCFGEVSDADCSYIFGEYWKDYYKEQYLEKYTQFVIVGYPELEGITIPVDKNAFEDASRKTICYLAQTSVEDGLMPLSDMKSFVSELAKCLDNYNLVIKLHPRSNHQIYQELMNVNNDGKVMIWDRLGFPETDFYLGHESTVVARAMYITSKTLIVRLNPDRVSPFEQYACFTAKSYDHLIDTIDCMVHDEGSIIDKSFREYVYYNKIGAIRHTAIDILNRLDGSLYKRGGENHVYHWCDTGKIPIKQISRHAAGGYLWKPC